MFVNHGAANSLAYYHLNHPESLNICNGNGRKCGCKTFQPASTEVYMAHLTDNKETQVDQTVQSSLL